MVIGVYKGIKAGVAQRVEIRLGSIAVVLIVDPVMLTGVGSSVRNGGFKISYGKVGGL